MTVFLGGGYHTALSEAHILLINNQQAISLSLNTPSMAYQTMSRNEFASTVNYGSNALLTQSVNDTVPKPSRVMLQSLTLPGWGQVTNKQIWKVPAIYAMLGGLTYYAFQMDNNYKDYRAAYYNSQYPDGDFKFGPTPGYLSGNINPASLRYNRNFYRNRRDLTILGVVLAYALNVIDAYVFAHMRDFDVSDDLSLSIIRVSGRTYTHGVTQAPFYNIINQTGFKPAISIHFRF